MAPASFASINLTVLGSASAQPSSTRNHSSLALRIDGDVWLFDCGEATQSQVQRSSVKMGKIQKIFITHTHGDHIFGLLPLLASCLDGAGGTIEGVGDARSEAAVLESLPLEIYGPFGTRAYVRTGLTYTHTLLGTPYVVHELRTTSDPTSDPTDLRPHPFEREGQNFVQQDGVWPQFFSDGKLTVSAAPILHSVPCVGYVLDESPVPGKIDPRKYIPDIKRTKSPMSVLTRLQQGERAELADGTVLEGPPRRPGRKIVILGDTYDPSPIVPLAMDADLLVHEATNAHIPEADSRTKPDDTYESVQKKAMERGHSTPQMAGAFAKRIRAKKMLLNHFSARYPGNDDVDEGAKKIMGAIRDLAVQEFGSNEVVCARDFMTSEVDLPRE